MKNRFLSRYLALRTGKRKRFRRSSSADVPHLNLAHAARERGEPAEFLFECDGCGCEFAPTPASFILNTPVRIVEEDADQASSNGDYGLLNRATLESLNEFELTERGLTEEERQTLLRGETIFLAADAFCASCLHQLFR